MIERDHSLGSEATRWAELYIALTTGYLLQFDDEDLIAKESARIASLGNDLHTEWLISKLLFKGQRLREHNQTRVAIAHQRLALAITSLLHRATPERWAEDFVGNLISLAGSLRDVDVFQRAQALLEEARDICSANKHDLPKETARLWSSLGWLQYKQGRYSEAVVSLRRSVSLRVELFGEDDKRTKSVRDRLAQAEAMLNQ